MLSDNYKEARSKLISIYDMLIELEQILYEDMSYEEKYTFRNHYESQIELCDDLITKIKSRY